MHNTTIEEALKSGKTITRFTVGPSMQPLLYARDTLVVIRPVDGDLGRGELPLYKRPNGKYIMHRIIRVRKDAYITRGDNQYLNETVPKEWVLGVVCEIHRRGKAFKTDAYLYRLYVWFWLFSYPVRHALYSLYKRIKKHEKQVES